MDAGFISEVILPVVFAIVGIALIWAIVELVLVLRRTGLWRVMVLEPARAAA